MTVPISQPRMPPSRYSAIDSDWPGYSSGGMCGSIARASMYTAWPPMGRMTGTPECASASPR